MPPKQEAKEDIPLLGRPTNNVTIGLVGLPNVGKSSLFNLLSGLQVAAENYPFCTIDPSTAIVTVQDPRFDHLCQIVQPKNAVPAVLSITDIAGLVKGAHEGKGLGNAFLSNIAAVDAIYHVTRAFVDKEIEHVEGSVDPCRDFEIIRNELIQKDIHFVNNALTNAQKALRTKTPGAKENLETCEKALALLKDNKEIRHGQWNIKDIDFLNTLNLLTAKPAVYLINISSKNFLAGGNKFFAGIKEWVAKNSPSSPVIPFSVPFEQEVQNVFKAGGADAKAKFLAESKVPSQVDKIILSGYKALSLIHYFTCGVQEVRAWSIRKGTKAPQAAGVIHSDFEHGFICADVYNYDDMKEHGSETAVKAAGKCRMQGKEYIFKDGDIAFFKHNAGGAKKK